jgi:hypothetical protein
MFIFYTIRYFDLFHPNLGGVWELGTKFSPSHKNISPSIGAYVFVRETKI